MLNDRVIPFFDSHNIKVLRILTDRGTEYKGSLENHAYELFLSVEGIEHSKTKAYSPQTNGICERFHRTLKEEFYDTAFRKKIYNSRNELQKDLDEWLDLTLVNIVMVKLLCKLFRKLRRLLWKKITK